MSAYKTIETEFRTAESLAKALADLGIKAEIAKSLTTNSVGLYGYHGDLRPERVVFRIPQTDVNRWSTGASNDVGFCWNPTTKRYDAIVSDYDRTNGRTQKMLDDLKQRYAFHEINRQARAKGYTVRESRTANGTISMTLVRR